MNGLTPIHSSSHHFAVHHFANKLSSQNNKNLWLTRFPQGTCLRCSRDRQAESTKSPQNNRRQNNGTLILCSTAYNLRWRDSTEGHGVKRLSKQRLKPIAYGLQPFLKLPTPNPKLLGCPRYQLPAIRYKLSTMTQCAGWYLSPYRISGS
jgi:hypothetical protein